MPHRKPAFNVRIRPDIYEHLAKEAVDMDSNITHMLNNLLADRYGLPQGKTYNARPSTESAARRLTR